MTLEWYDDGMKTTIDRAGRVVIPKGVRDEAGLRPGTSVRIEYKDGKVEIEPVGKRVRWVRKGSFIVARAPHGTPKMTSEQVRKMIEESREERIQQLWKS
jgi:AbrB family looped-hinge helix DNA binding protein